MAGLGARSPTSVAVREVCADGGIELVTLTVITVVTTVVQTTGRHRERANSGAFGDWVTGV